jgi:phosphoribosylamine---glycine ligase
MNRSRGVLTPHRPDTRFRLVKTLRVLVIGSGGREHALAWRLAQDAEVSEVLVAPGNDGIGRSFRRLDLQEIDGPALVKAAEDERADLAVVGPDAALAAGVADAFDAARIPVFGPTRAAARLEWSKWFAKEVMTHAAVPTARASRFDRLDDARRALASFGPPWVIKADGLAAGKGVLVTRDRGEALDFLAACLEGGKFGESGRTVLMEEFLEGEELSLMALCDGHGYALLAPARDYKRAQDGDQGPNTGGMGAYAPAADAAFADQAGRRIVLPMLTAMSRRGIPFRGAMYMGLMVTRAGPKVLEINARFGDPESQAVLPLVEGSLAQALLAAARGDVAVRAPKIRDQHAVAVALVDEGYPDAVRGGGVVENLDAAAERHGVLVFHAGTKREGEQWVIRGGRAAHLVAVDATRVAARAKAYAAIADLGGSGWRTRSDIAADGASVDATLPHHSSRGA